MAQKYNVFYSWASENTNGDKIEKAILSVIDELNRNYNGVYAFELIKAIRDDDPGSPNISQKIRERIRKSNVFIGDITPFYKGRRKWFFTRSLLAIPNPNVNFEYGFAEAYLGEDRCIIFEDSAILSEKSEHINRPFDFQQYNRIIVRGDDFSATKQTIRNEIEKVVKKKPEIIRAGLLDETEYDTELSKKMFKELDIEQLVEMIGRSVDQCRHDEEYIRRIDEMVCFLFGVNKFFNEELEICRLQVASSLSELRKWECSFFSLTITIMRAVVITL